MNRKFLIFPKIILLSAVLLAGCVKLSVKTEITCADRGSQTPAPNPTPTSPGSTCPLSTDDTLLADMAAQKPTPPGGDAPAAGGRRPGGPFGNGETLPFSVNNAANNTATTGCFPANLGWDKYIPLPKFLVGPNCTPNANAYPNNDNAPSLTITTAAIGNGPTVETGIVIYPALAPSDRTCGPDVPGGEAVTRAPTTSGTYYKAGVFYKSATLPPGTTTVFIRWQYP